MYKKTRPPFTIHKMEAQFNKIKEQLEEIRRNAMSSDERALFDAKSELELRSIGSKFKNTFTTRDTLLAADISSTEIVVFRFNPTNLGSDSSTIGGMIEFVPEAVIPALTEEVIPALTEEVIPALTEGVTKSPLQEILKSYQALKDCHRRIGEVLRIIRSCRLFSEEFLDRIHIIKLYLMTNKQRASSDILNEINAYPARTFRVFTNGISSVYELEKFFGHSVLGWQDRRTGEWFILDFLFMPISDVGYGMPLIHYLTLVVHNDDCPVIVVPVVRHPSMFRPQTCLDGLRLRNTIMGVVDSAKNEVYPDIAELYKGDILREEP